MLNIRREKIDIITRVIWCIGTCIGILLLICSSAVLTNRIMAQSGNHTSIDIRHLWYLCTVSLFWCAIGMKFRKRRWFRYAMIVLAVLAIGLAGYVYFLDYYNILVEHDTWCGRRMPLRWEH